MNLEGSLIQRQGRDLCSRSQNGWLRQDVVGMNCLRDESGNLVVKPKMARKS